MNDILITGASGFVGKNLIKYIGEKKKIRTYVKQSEIFIAEDIVIHLAGKAHDIKNITNTDEYYTVNTDLTKMIFDSFLISDAKVFITLSSVKAVADNLENILNEETLPSPKTHYGKSKLLAEEYILSKKIPNGKRIYILRPCMIHGPGNKGNLNKLYRIIIKGFPWPLGNFHNLRSFCSIENICFIINEIIDREDIPSGVYNVADDMPLSTNEIIRIIAESRGKSPFILNINKSLIRLLMKVGDIFNLPINTERLNKLTENFIVNNSKIKNALGISLPITSIVGFKNTFHSFSTNQEV